MKARHSALWTLSSLILLSLLVSCAGFGSKEASAGGTLGGRTAVATSEAPRKAAPPPSSAKRASAPQESAADALLPSGAVPSAAPRGGAQTVAAPGGGPPPPAQAPSERKRVYEATLELSVASVEQSKRRIIALTQTAGGYTESSVEQTLVIRVPAARFDEVLAAVQELGEVRSRSIQSTDVTDQFADLTLRLKTAEASRTRLYQLLEQAEKAQERLAILREIRRLTEQIEQLRSSLDSLGRLVEFSRITVYLASRMQEERVTRSAIPFRWIAQLAPVRRTTADLKQPIELSLPEDFAVFSKDRFVRAEAADGTQLRIGSVPNDPKGDTSFWASALAFHLARQYARTDRLEAGRFKGVAFSSRDAKPFVYAVLAAVRDTEIVVVEIYLPSEKTAHERLEALRAMVEGVTL